MGILRAFALLVGFWVVAAPATAHAAFHLMKIVEVFPGTPASPNAQYVVLQMHAVGQNIVSGQQVSVYNSAGTLIQAFTFSSNVPNGANQSRILIATTQAQTFFGVTANLTMSPVIPLAGGKICFGTVDCVAWGNYTGPATGVGTPASPTGLPGGKALKRRLDIVAPATTLQGGDDTDNSANDFVLGTPAPINNAGQSGVIPPSTCGNNSTEGLEACDDGNTTPGDGCNAMCVVEFCGDGAPGPNETCDDGNLIDGDGCDTNCTVTACGNGVPTTGESCDDGNLTSGDGCDANCTMTSCGNGIMTTGEVCDDGNLTSGDGCDINCTVTACGNGIVTAGEACDDGNLIDGDGCDSNCTVAGCGNGATTPPEVCDDGNLVDGDGCDSNCTPTGCGNGIATTGEACDDGNLVDGDGCDSNCTMTACGNGVITEACDDGNLVDGDGCDSNCTVTACGNGIVTAPEECEPPGEGACDPTCIIGCAQAMDCVDDDACTAAQCADWVCSFAPIDVDDLEDCTADACDAMTGESHTPVADGTDCFDLATSMGGFCAAGVCAASTCGDGIVDPARGEECDGDTTSVDCTADCLIFLDEGDGGGCCSTGRSSAPNWPATALAALGLTIVLRRRRRG